MLGSPRLHHWHHHPAAGQICNFGNLNPLMDRLFGTWCHPHADPDAYGDPEQPTRSYVAHVVAAFMPEKHEFRG